jgi:hypothetical protein
VDGGGRGKEGFIRINLPVKGGSGVFNAQQRVTPFFQDVGAAGIRAASADIRLCIPTTKTCPAKAVHITAVLHCVCEKQKQRHGGRLKHKKRGRLKSTRRARTLKYGLGSRRLHSRFPLLTWGRQEDGEHIRRARARTRICPNTPAKNVDANVFIFEKKQRFKGEKKKKGSDLETNVFPWVRISEAQRTRTEEIKKQQDATDTGSRKILHSRRPRVHHLRGATRSKRLSLHNQTVRDLEKSKGFQQDSSSW